MTKINSSAFANCTSLESISIPASVTSIGSSNSDYSNLPFYYCTSLKKVVFEDSDSSVSLGSYYYSYTGKGLFYYCPLEEVYIGRNLSYASNYEYGYSPFYNRTKLIKVTIGDKVTSLNSFLFYKCSNLKSLKLGENITSIQNYCFSECDLSTIEFPEGLTSIGQYAFEKNANLTTAKLPATLQKIDNYAFRECSNLKYMDFPNGLSTLGEYAFASSGLEIVKLPEAITTLGMAVFAGSNVRIVDIQSSMNVSIPSCAFENCQNLTECNIGDNITAISGAAFRGCSKLKTVNIGKSVKTIGLAAFANCTSLESITIPASVTSIGSSNSDYSNLPFYYCTSLKKVVFEDSDSSVSLGSYYYSYTGKGLFYYCPLEEVYIGRNLSYASNYEYGYSPFYNRTKLIKVTIGDKVTSLGNYLFQKCNQLSKIVCLAKKIPTANSQTFDTGCDTTIAYVPYNTKNEYSTANYWSSIPEIREWFYDDICSYIPIDDNNVEALAHPDNRPESLNIPSQVNYNGGTFNVVAIAESGFQNFENLTTLTLPQSVTEIGAKAFMDCPKLNTVTFGGQKIIGNDAFRNCTSLINLTLPNELETIGTGAFKNDASIAQIEFKEGLKEIGAFAFSDCKALTAALLPNTLTRIGDSAFEDCVKLTYVSLGSQLESIGNSAFRNCSVLTEISIPGTTATIGYKAFQNCHTLALATLNPGIETIGGFCFDGCAELLSMTIPGSVKSIGGGSFDGCSSLSSLSFSNSENALEIPMFTDSPLKTLRIGRNLTYTFSNSISPFRDRTTLNRVMFTGNYVTTIYDYLLDGCTNVSSITLPDNLEVINSYAFRNCASLPLIILPGSLSEIKDGAFNGCKSLADITINDSDEPLTLGTANSMFDESPIRSLYVGRDIVYNLDSYNRPYEHAPFYRQLALTDLKFSTSGDVTSIPYYFLYEAENLSAVTFPESLVNIGDYAFSGDITLGNVQMPDDVTSAGEGAFRRCSALQNIHLSEKLERISEYLLADCTSLQSVYIPASVQSVGYGAFSQCTSLAEVRLNDAATPLDISYDSDSTGMFHNSPLKGLYIGRNINYTPAENYGYSPFYDITTLENVSFSQSGNVTAINNYMLAGCNSVKSFKLPASLVNIGDYAFYNMSALEYCDIPNSVTSLGKAVFMNDIALETVTLSNQLPTLDENVFNNCTLLNNLSIPASVKYINTGAFTACASMSNLRMEDGTEIMTVASKDGENSLFADCPVTDLYLGRWLSYDINTKTVAPFCNQTGLTKLTISPKAGTIGKYLFSNCSTLPAVAIPDGIESIGEEAFYQCEALKTLSLGEGLTSLGERAFAGNISLDNVIMPSTLTSISDGCFSNCSNLINLRLNANLGIIGPRAFENCSKLASLDIPAKVYGLGVESFQGCASLPYITIPEGALSSVGARAFKGCTNAASVSIGKNVTSLGVNCFQDCAAINHIKVYNTVPPVGSPGFPQNVVDNGTVFVPAESVDDYKDSDTWWEFFRILPLTDTTLVSSITLDKTQATICDSETLQLTASALPNDATDATVLYRSNDTEVATVDGNGLITGKAPGEAVITAYTADGSGVYAECHLTVTPTPVQRIDGDSDYIIKVGREGQITTTVYPENATYRTLTWKSDNTSVVTIDEDGTLHAQYKGTANITASATDGSGVTYRCAVTVIPPTAGDSNDDDRVTITDAVNTANYAVGNEVKDFCEEAADVNGDNRITLADATATVSIVLNQPAEDEASPVRARSIIGDVDSDALIIDDFMIAPGQHATVAVHLNDSRDYVALQGDIILPSGLSIVDIKTGERGVSSHVLATNTLGNDRVRFALFDINNSTFADTDDAIILVTVYADREITGELKISNAYAADADAIEYRLTSEGGRSDITTAVGTTVDDSIVIAALDNTIHVYNAMGENIIICSSDGAVVVNHIAASDDESISLMSGIYIVSAGRYSKEIMIK
ncbi:MAG: leucine-rich repeat protein [Muribaculaceae bacterium]|nr:leucine-rich repeat protein [Muribaculaceae bacterium]